MRILYIINSFTWAGAEKLVFDLAKGIRSNTDGVAVAALYRNGDETELEMISSLEQNEIKTLILDKGAGKGHFSCIRRLMKFVKKQEITVIHGHCSVPMLFAKIIGKLAGIPVICTIHNTKGYSAQKEIITAWMVNQYISICQTAEEYMTNELNISNQKITRIYNAVEVDHFQNAEKRDNFWEQYGIPNKSHVVLSIGRLTEQKNQLCLAKALVECINRGDKITHVALLGAYKQESSLYQQIQACLKDGNALNHFHFLGLHKNVPEFMANSDCFVMTSWYEGLSVSFLEAVFSGLPIVTTELSFVKELNQISLCAIEIPQNDYSALATLIMNRSYSPQSTQTIEKFSELFSMNAFVQKHLEVYRRYT